MPHHYYIIGFMGSGKTSVGQALAEKLNYEVIDIDQWIEQTEQQVIRDIFETKGEDYFRTLETNALQTITGNNMIITTGGGIITTEFNRQFMKENGVTIYLKCDSTEIVKRLEGDKSRPNFKGDLKQVVELFQKRKVFYEQADITVDTTGKHISKIVDELAVLLK